jgi:hypothetical protein
MRLRSFLELLGVLWLVFVLSAFSATARHAEASANHQSAQPTATPSQSDPISGAWDVSFFVNGSAHPSTFDLRLEGTKVTGTAASDHTGPGTVRDGAWSDGKLSFTLDFKKHESIAIKGTLKDGKLSGEFTTEGFTSNWEAKRK